MAEEAKKEGFFKRTAAKAVKFFKDLRGEMKKIVWPSKKQVLNNTGIVIIVVVISSVLVGCLDFILHGFVALIQ